MVSKSLIAASSKPLVLTVLSNKKSYGYEIIQNIKKLSNGVLQWSDGMLYPILHKLEKEGLIIGSWEISETGRKRKYYSTTEAGLDELQREKNEWKSVNDTLSSAWSFKVFENE